MWWTFTTPANGVIRVSTHGSSFSTVLAVYTGNELANLTVVAESKANNWDDDLSSQVEFTAYAGTTYQVAVDGAESPAESGDIILSLTLSPPTAPYFYRQPLHQYAENLGPPVELTPGQFIFQDTEAKSRPGRFYRLSQQ